MQLQTLLAGALLVLVVLGAFSVLWAPWPSVRRSFPEGDFYDQFYAFARYEHERLWSGEIPLWSPRAFGGHPFLADVQAAVLYPPSLAVMALSGPGSFSPEWLQVEAVAHYLLAALGTYALLCRLTARANGQGNRAAAFLGALTFTLGGYLTAYPPLQLAILETQAWLPLLLLFLDVGLTRRRWDSILAAGAVWGMALLAGHPQSAMYVLYLSLAYGLFRGIQQRQQTQFLVLSQGAWVLVGLGLAAVQLLPAAQLTLLSVRASASYQELAGGFGLPELVQLVLPGTVTHWSPMYVGILALYLALAAAVGGILTLFARNDPRPRQGLIVADALFWSAVTLVSLVLSLGGKGLLYRLFYWLVPGFNLFRSQERAVFCASFALAVLASLGWAWWDRQARDPSAPAGKAAWAPKLAWAVMGSNVLVTLVALGLLVLGQQSAAAWLRWAVFGWLAWGIVKLTWRGFAWTPVLAAVVVLADLGMACVSVNLEPGPASARVYDSAWLKDVLSDASLFRTANEWGLPGNVGPLLDIQDLYGASPLRLQRHQVMSDALPHWRLWQLFGVRYVATWQHDLPGPLPAVRVGMQGEEWSKNAVYLFRLDRAPVRAWVVYHAQQVDDDTALALLQSSEFDPFDRVLLHEPVPSAASAKIAGDPSPVRVIRYAPQEIVLEAVLAEQGWLVLGEWDYPGWRAWVDSAPAQIHRADYGLRAVEVPPGTHQVTFRFRPGTVYVGAVISLLAWCGLGYGFVRRRLRPATPDDLAQSFSVCSDDK